MSDEPRRSFASLSTLPRVTRLAREYLPTMSSFAWPPMYAFPPFFTLQPVDATRAKQVEQWKQVVMAWHAAHKKSELAVKEWPGWENPAIKREYMQRSLPMTRDALSATCTERVAARLSPPPLRLSSSLVSAGRLSDEGIQAVANHIVATGECMMT